MPQQKKPAKNFASRALLFLPALGITLFLFALHLYLLVPPSVAGTGSRPERFEDLFYQLAQQLKPGGERLAVYWVYEEESGNVTALGNQWQDRIEKALLFHGLSVAIRREMGFILDEQNIFGNYSEYGGPCPLRQSEAQVLVSAAYQLRNNKIYLTIKAMRGSEGELLGVYNWKEPLPANWQRLASQIRGNVYLKGIEKVEGTDSDSPALQASLNRNPPCYPPGGEVVIEVESSPGAYLYILNLAADNTATILYPGPLPDQPLPFSRFVFPPPALADDLSLHVFPLPNEVFSQESFKIIDSRQALDFSFLPYPENQLFHGAEGAELRRILKMLNQSSGWRAVDLGYGVGQRCE